MSCSRKEKITEISSIRGGPHGKHEMENGQADLRAKGQPNPTPNPTLAATKEISVQQPQGTKFSQPPE